MKTKTNFRLRCIDKYNWSVDQRVVFKKKDSKGKAWKTVGYFPSLDQAAQCLLDKTLLSKGNGSSIEALIKEVTRAREHIARLILTQSDVSTTAPDPEGVGGPRASKIPRSPQGIPARLNELSKAETRKPKPSTSSF